MSSSTALIVYLFFSIVLLYLVSKFSLLDPEEMKSPTNSDQGNKKVSITTLSLLLVSGVVSIFLSTYNFKDFSVDYDSMSVQLNFLIRDEIKFQMWNGRFFPLSHVDNAILLKLFKSFSALKVYLILHFILLITISYFAFDFIPKNRRLVLLSLIAISPPLVNIYSSAIYSERNILLFLVTSILFLRLSTRGILASKLALFLSMTSFFISLYFKETTILYATSFLAFSFILKNFETLKALDHSEFFDYFKKPLNYIESLFLIPCLLWLLSFFLLGGELNPEYIAKRDNSLIEYIQQNSTELVVVTIMFLATMLRAKFDLYFVFLLSCIPMALYCLFVSQSVGAYNIFTYYNYLIYIAFSMCIISEDRLKFIFFVTLTFLTFTLISLNGFVDFTEKVNERNKVLNKALELVKKGKLDINLKEPWKERNVTRFILYKANQGHINHVTNHDLFCKDTDLYNEKTVCTIKDEASACMMLVASNKSKDQPEEMKVIEVGHERCR